MSSNKKKLEGHIINTIDHSLAIELYVDRQLGRKAVAERFGRIGGDCLAYLVRLWESRYGVPLKPKKFGGTGSTPRRKVRH